jgi:hypothetical protein
MRRWAVDMMHFKDPRVSQVLVGLHRVGIVGLGDALKEVDQEGLEDREAIVAAVVERLRSENYIPDAQLEEYRTAIWREYLRMRGEDFSEFLSPVEVIVRGDPGPERDRFEELVRSVLASFELRPVVAFEPADASGPNPQLAVDDDTIVRGVPGRERLKRAVRQRLSDW